MFKGGDRYQEGWEAARAEARLEGMEVRIGVLEGEVRELRRVLDELARSARLMLEGPKGGAD